MQAESHAILKERWNRLVASFDLSADHVAANRALENLVTRYGKSHRHYHHLGHIRDCLDRFDELPTEHQSGELEFARWFHDVYRSSSERQRSRRPLRSP